MVDLLRRRYEGKSLLYTASKTLRLVKLMILPWMVFQAGDTQDPTVSEAAKALHVAQVAPLDLFKAVIVNLALF